MGIVGIVDVSGDLAALAFKTVEAAAVADPERAAAVVEESADGGAFGIARSGEQGGEVGAGPVHAVEAAEGGADPEGALVVLAKRVDLVVPDGAGIAGMVAVRRETSRLPVEGEEAAVVGAGPKEALSVEAEGQDFVGGSGGPWLRPGDEMVDLAAVGIDAVESVLGADPEYAGTVEGEGIDVIAAEGRSRARVGTEAEKALAGAVETIQAAVLGAHPEVPLAIFDDATDEIGRKAVRLGWVRQVHGEGIAVVAVQTFIGAAPEEALTVLKEAVDLAVGEPLIDGIVAELQLAFLAVAGAGPEHSRENRAKKSREQPEQGESA